MKYKTLAELKAAYESGELPREDALVIDNDCTTVYQGRHDGGPHSVLEEVFDGGPPSVLLEEALSLLGIPWEPA